MLALPVIVIGEYRYGLSASRLREDLERALTALTQDVTVLPIDLETTRAYAEVRRELRDAGRSIPENDVWIAALTRRHGLPLLSRDEHFDQVKGITRISW